MYKVYAFDFDGTLTRRDSLLAFIRYAKGNCAFLTGFLRYSPQLLLMLLHLYSNARIKQKIFAHYFKGMTLEAFNGLCRRFARDRRDIIREAGLVALHRALTVEGARVLIISASIDNWVSPFFEMTEEPRNVRFSVVGTKVEVSEGRLTGRFLTHNCYGEEKVRRLLRIYPDRADYTLTAYGDSRGDREMLLFADQSYYQPFRNGYDGRAFAALRKAHFFKLYGADEADGPIG